jgi:hypothetical protein
MVDILASGSQWIACKAPDNHIQPHPWSDTVIRTLCEVNTYATFQPFSHLVCIHSLLLSQTEGVRKEVAGLQAEAAALRAGTGADSAVTVLPDLLSRAARAYRSLYASVLKAGAQPPPEVLPSALGLATWMDDALAGAADWNDLDDVARGYVIVNALPMHARAPPKAQNGFADGFGDSAFGAPAAPAFGSPAAPTATSVPSAAPAATTPINAPAQQPAAVHVSEAAARVFNEPPAFGAPATAPTAKTGASQGPASGGATGSGGGGFEEDNAFGAPAFGTTAPGGTAPAQQPQQATAPAPPASTGFGFEDSAFS